MMRSMFAAVSGLQAYQTMMDVVGDNISNINTTGFKASRAIFEDTLSQVMNGASAPGPNSGGVNPSQLGLGVRVGNVGMIDSQGPIQNTGRSTDVAIQGAGYFAVRTGQETMYTRAGAFGFDEQGFLVDPTGSIVQGWMGANGAVSTNGPVGDIQLPVGQTLPPVATTSVTCGGNLSVDAAAGTTFSTAINVYDSQGNAHRMSFDYTKGTTSNDWTLTVKDENGATLGTSALQFDAQGALSSPSTPPSFTANVSGAAPVTFTVDMNAPGSAVTQYGGSSTIAALDQNGATSGTLRSFAIGNDGTVSGVFSNGRSEVLARVALATFNNPTALIKDGDAHFSVSANSGQPRMGTPGTNGGSLAAGALEGSNVDLSREFTNLIIAQRGFQANSRVITSSDEMRQDLVNMKH